MSLSLRCFAYAQISFVVSNTNKKNYKANCTEIAKVKVFNSIKSPPVFYSELTPQVPLMGSLAVRAA